MAEKYQPKEFEKKWAKEWQKEKLYSFNVNDPRPKFYDLVELPYTSGDLHIGHWFAFVTPDVLARFKRMNGFNVFFPMGYDAFGLPAENAAIKHKVHPRDWTMKNIKTMTSQFQQMGTMIDWDRITVTCLPEYYRWNQWIFLKMFERGLIYRGKALSNWCPGCQTVLANENVVNGLCWRCDKKVEQKEVPQWFIKITAYAQKLIWPDKPSVDWPISVRVGQNNWIGKSQGAKVNFRLENGADFWVFTTRLDTIFGATFLVISPEKIDLKIHVGKDHLDEVKKYLDQVKKKSELERQEAKEKTGVFTGVYGINPFSGEKIPLYVADYVLGFYGEGRIMGVPAHDERDWAFAQKFNLPVKEVIKPPKNQSASQKTKKIFTDYGILVNSGRWSGLKSQEAIEKMLQFLRVKKLGETACSYHLRDWSISRQRYWGTPVPIVYCRNCYINKTQSSKLKTQSCNLKVKTERGLKEGIDYMEINGEKYAVILVPEDQLPVQLPYEVDFTPRGKPPLATNEKWLNVPCPKCGRPAKRDPETLDTFFDSAWYWFRYLSPKYNQGPFDKKLAKKFTPVDVYFGGAEHTLGHTLYARFFTKFFYDIGLVNYQEFALKRVQHGIVLGPDGNKMSKSKGNVINPDEQVKEYGADAVRIYLCFMMPYEGTGPWSDETIAGVNRFLNRVWKLYHQYQISNIKYQNDKSKIKNIGDKKLISKLNKTIKKVTHDIQNIKMNTAIAAMMEFLNDWEKKVQNSKFKVQSLTQENAKKFLQILAPFAPFITEEIWRNVFGEKQSIHLSEWPKVEEVEEEEMIIPVQVNGKLRGTIKVKRETCNVKREVEKKALEEKKVKKYLEGKKYKVVYVPGKILNFVTL